MMNNIFEFYYATDMYFKRLKPLTKEELSRGLTVAAIDKYLNLVGTLYLEYVEYEFDVNVKHTPVSIESRRQKALSRSKIYDDLIKHLFKQDSISEDAYFELYKGKPLDFNWIEHPSIKGRYVMDSLDDFRLKFEKSIVENDININIRDLYLEGRYDYSICVKPKTPNKRWVTTSDLYIVRFVETNTDTYSVVASYGEVSNLLKLINIH